MKKWIFCVLICMLMMVTSIVPISATSLKKTSQSLNMGNILYVGGSGPGNYTKIQDAINNANQGDTVFVYDDSSPYYENIVIEKSISIIGEMASTTQILGDESLDGVIVNISADDVYISGFTIQPYNGTPAGIIVCKKYVNPDYWNTPIIQNINIFNNIIKNTSWAGIFGIRLNNANISGNDINHCSCGIQFFISSNNTITNNRIADCTGSGINIDGAWSPYRLRNFLNPLSENNLISRNIVLSNRWGIQLNGGVVNTIITQNNISANHGMFPGHDGIGIDIYQASKTQITNNNIIDNSQNACFTTILIFRYPQFVLNTWDGNYWGESSNTPLRITGTFWFMPFPRLPVDICFPNFSLTQWEVPWMAFDKHPAKEPYDIPGT